MTFAPLLGLEGVLALELGLELGAELSPPLCAVLAVVRSCPVGLCSGESYAGGGGGGDAANGGRDT